MARWFKYLILFGVLVALQVLVFGHLQFRGSINAFPYIYFILVLPFGIQGRNVLILSALIGLLVDFLSGTMGVHMAASVAAGFFRLILLPALAPQGDYDSVAVPSVRNNGWAWFLRYAVFMVLVHHLILFWVEAFSFSNFGITLLNALFSSLFTILIILLFQLSIRKELS